MSARAYDWFFAFWMIVTVVKMCIGSSELAVYGSLILAIICGGIADILKASKASGASS